MATNSGKEKPRVIVKWKKDASGGHHGGSWKVAYADFVTAMMAFFLVMWIVGLDDAHKQSIESYFNDPLGRKGEPAGAIVPGPGTAPGGDVSIVPMIADKEQAAALTKEGQLESFMEAKRRIEEALRQNEAFVGMREFIEIRITEEGLVIEMLDSEESFFFELGSAKVKPKAESLFALIAEEVGKLPNPVVFEGHTDAAPFRKSSDYTNWELSVDRANRVRVIMQSSGLRPGQTSEVRGYGPNQLRRPEEPHHYSNRRVSILARYLTAKDGPAGN